MVMGSNRVALPMARDSVVTGLVVIGLIGVALDVEVGASTTRASRVATPLEVSFSNSPSKK